MFKENKCGLCVMLPGTKNKATHSRNSCVNHDASQDYDVIEQDEDVRLHMSKRRIIWNLFLVNICYFMFNTGFWGLSTLQSTMNAVEGMGPDSQAVIYGASMVSSLLFPDFTIKKFGCKKASIVAITLSIPYLASNMYLRWDLLLSTSALIGLATGPFNGAITVYIDELAWRFHKQYKYDLEYTLVWFFGINNMFTEGTQISGSAIASFVLTDKNPSHQTNHSESFKCGLNFNRNQENVTNSNLEPPSDYDRYMLGGIYVALGVLCVITLILFLDPLYNDVSEDTGWRTVCNSFMAAAKHMIKLQQIFLIPISVFLGLGNAFYQSEFTEAYIACAWGIQHVSFVTICFGVCGVISSLLVGPLVKCMSQTAVLILAVCCSVSLCIFLLLWEPSPDKSSISLLFIAAGMWGMTDGILWSQVTALYGLMFPNDREAAFSNLYFWSYVGSFISYSYANFLTVAVKIYILLAFLGTGILGYLFGHIMMKCSKKEVNATFELK